MDKMKRDQVMKAIGAFYKIEKFESRIRKIERNLAHFMEGFDDEMLSLYIKETSDQRRAE